MGRFNVFSKSSKFISWSEYVIRVSLYNDIVNIHNMALQKLRGELE